MARVELKGHGREKTHWVVGPMLGKAAIGGMEAEVADIYIGVW